MRTRGQPPRRSIVLILLLLNPAATFAYTFAGAAITAARNITLPLLTANDTMAVLGFAQTFTAAQTFTNGDFLLLGTSTGATTLNSGLSGAGNNTLTLPITSSDTLAALGTIQVWSAAQTFNGALTFGSSLTSSGTQTWALKANTASALQITDGTNAYLTVNTQTTTSGIAALTLNGTAPTIASAAGVTYSGIMDPAFTMTLTGTTTVTALNGLQYYTAAPTVTDSSSVTVTTASTIYIAGAPIAGGSVTITNAYTLLLGGGALGLTGSSTGITALLSGLSGSSNNILTLPTTASDTLAAIGTAQTWSALQTFGTNISILGAQFSGAGPTTNQLIQYNGTNWIAATVTASTVAWSGLTNPSASLSLTMAAADTTTFTLQQTTLTGFTWTSSTLTSGVLAAFTSTSTALAAGNSLVTITSSGANGTNAITATGLTISVTNTNVTSGTNVALTLTASGATTANYALSITGGNIQTTAAITWAVKANTASSLIIQDASGNPYYTINTQTSTSTAVGNLFTCAAPTIASAASATFFAFAMSNYIVTLTGTTTVTAMNGVMMNLGQPQLTDSSAVTVTTASTAATSSERLR